MSDWLRAKRPSGEESASQRASPEGPLVVKGRLRLQSGRFPPAHFAPKGRVSRRLATGGALRGSEARS
ncbi:MAG: hypothetical protein ACHBN1_27565, partial [Heteroscytonema crispum UTEX LB 1556]